MGSRQCYFHVMKIYLSKKSEERSCYKLKFLNLYLEKCLHLWVEKTVVLTIKYAHTSTIVP